MLPDERGFAGGWLTEDPYQTPVSSPIRQRGAEDRTRSLTRRRTPFVCKARDLSKLTKKSHKGVKDSNG
jgi:hypothetical protein